MSSVLSKQEMLDKVWDWFVVQKKGPSVSETPTGKACMYRGENGTKCGAGVLIPDDKYDKRMEFKIIHNVLNEYPELKEILPNEGEGYRFLRSIQIIHDDNAWYTNSFTNTMRSGLTNLANNYQLVIPTAETE